MGSQTAVASGDRQDQVGRASMTKKHKWRQNEIRGAAVARKHTQRRKGNVGQFACLSVRPSTGYLYESESAAIQCMLHREREGKAKVKVERESLAGDRAHGVVCKGEPVIRLENSE